MRRFGLFHFPGQSSARVRRVVWTGDWPKQLPALEDQELAEVEFITKLVPDAPVKANSLELQTLTGGIGRTSVVWKSLTIRAKGLSDIK